MSESETRAEAALRIMLVCIARPKFDWRITEAELADHCVLLADALYARLQQP